MKRNYQPLIKEYLSYFPCVALIGARQMGKSTLLHAEGGSRSLFDLEARADYEQIARDPDFFLRSNDQPIAIDEAQLLPELFPALRVAIDRDRLARGKYLLSGSSSPELLNVISESLAGRVGVIEIAPLSYAEIKGVDFPFLLTLFDEACSSETLAGLANKPAADDLQLIQSYWFHGGYPEPWLNDTDRFREIWKEQYFKSFIERDIARLFPNLNTVRFRRFIEILAGYSGTVINYSNLARMLDVSQPTVKDYLRIAHGTFLWRTLPAYDKSVSKRIIKHPRGYFRDTGMLHHILQMPSFKRLLSHPQMGASWESLVIEEILRGANAAGIACTPYYYRTAAGAEVDLVLEGKFGLIPFEIKHTQTVNAKYLRSLRDFVNEFDCRFGIVVNNDEKIRRYDERLFGVPFSMLCMEGPRS